MDSREDLLARQSTGSSLHRQGDDAGDDTILSKVSVDACEYSHGNDEDDGEHVNVFGPVLSENADNSDEQDSGISSDSMAVNTKRTVPKKQGRSAMRWGSIQGSTLV